MSCTEKIAHKFFAPVKGFTALVLIALNTIILSIGLFATALFLIIPIAKVRTRVTRAVHKFPVIWTDANNKIMDLTSPVHWEIQGGEDLKIDDWYLMIANHRSWIDILILFRIFNHKIPSLKFFMKKELLWQFPFASQCCWLMGFPFMKRYSKETLKKYPHLKGKDVEITRKACEKFKTMPTTIINFIEGGRFSEQKHKRQASPYRYLLKPKAGGIAFVLATMGDSLNTLVNVTLIYPHMQINLWDFLCGRIKKVTVVIETLPITSELLGDYENDRVYRANFQKWLNKLWERKDQLIGKRVG